MKLSSIILFLAIITIANDIHAQIIMNGRNPSRYGTSNSGGSALSISFGPNIWADGGATPIPGYSSSLADFHSFGGILSLEKANFTQGLNLGYEKNVSERLAVRASFYTANMTHGAASRLDLLTTDKSKFTQLGLYARYTLTKNMDRRIQFQWLLGPELIYARKDMIIAEYVLDETATPQPYHEDITITEVALVTGPGASCRIAGGISLFTDSMFGLSFPGKGFKLTQTGLGLKYSW